MDVTEISSLVRGLFPAAVTVPLTPATRLMEEGICDSLGLVQLALEIEGRTGIRIPDQDITAETFGSISAIAAFLASRRGSSLS